MTRPQKKKGPYLALIVILGALLFLVTRGLGNATEYFRTTSEAVKVQNKIGTSRFRLEGIVVEGSICTLVQQVVFSVEENGQRIEVHHQGDPPELFQPNIPVVVSGQFDTISTHQIADTNEAPVFVSDNLMIKHSNVYKEKNGKRLKNFVGKNGTLTPKLISKCK